MKFKPGEIAILWNPEPGSEGTDFSYLHGEEVEIVAYAVQFYRLRGYQYEIRVPSLNDRMVAAEHELKKKYDGDEPTSWEGCAWKPTEETA